MEKVKALLQKPFFSNKYTLLSLWIIIAVAAAVSKFIGNNYLIFKFSFWHLIHQENLYSFHPQEYADLYHYGPLFGVLMAPFAVLPDWMGMLLWDVALALFLYWSIRQTHFKWGIQLFIFWFCAHELLTALMMQQMNVATVGMIILSYCYVQQGKDKWATFFIVLGTYIKLLGIVGLAFFFFSSHKKKFILWMAVWSIVMFALPMFFSSPEYIINSYHDWYVSLSSKNIDNLYSLHQNISLLGIIRKTLYFFYLGNINEFLLFINQEIPRADNCIWTNYSDIWIILVGLVLFLLPYLRLSQWKNESFRRMFLASTLMFICLFSTSTESSGYIIAIIGTVIWYTSVPWKRGKWAFALMILIFILTSLSPSDIIPKYLRFTFIWPFALKALPVVICWFWLIAEMLTKDYGSTMPINQLDDSAEPVVKKAE